MPTVQEVIKDPDFLGLPDVEKRKVLTSIDTDFAGLPDIEQNKVVMQFEAGGTGEISTWKDTALDIGKKTARGALEVGGAVVGGIAGAGAGGLGLPVGAGLGYAGGKRLADIVLGEQKPIKQDIRELPTDIAIGAAGELIPGVIDKARPVFGKAGKYLYERALKPTKTEASTLLQREAIAKTGYEKGITITKKGIEKWKYNKKQLGQSIDNVVDRITQEGKQVNVSEVAKRIDDLKPVALNSSEPKMALEALEGYKQEFIKQNKEIGRGFLTPRQLQDFKTQQYNLYEGAYGELKPLAKETEKALARGAKEELEAFAPELKGLNQQFHEIREFLNVTESAIIKQRNRSWIGMGVWGPLRVIADNPLVVSKAAQMFRKIDKAHPLADPATLKKILYYQIYYGGARKSNTQPTFDYNPDTGEFNEGVQ